MTREADVRRSRKTGASPRKLPPSRESRKDPSPLEKTNNKKKKVIEVEIPKGRQERRSTRELPKDKKRKDGGKSLERRRPAQRDSSRKKDERKNTSPPPEEEPSNLKTTTQLKRGDSPAEMEYEDDFEEYEEDFESDEDSQDGEEEELILVDSKMDSGNYDMTPRILKEITEVKNALFEENNNPPPRSVPIMKEEPERPSSSPLPSVFNFNAAKQRKKEIDKCSKVKKRGRELLSMIRLDTVNIDILNIPPISYEKFMSTYGRGRQSGCQTGHDDLDKEVQTESNEALTKWTQFPPPLKFDSSSPILDIIRGVGSGDEYEEQPVSLFVSHPRLDEFITFGGNLILSLLEEKESRFLGHSKANTDLKGLEAIASNNTSSLPVENFPHLKNLLCLRFATHQPYTLFTCHYDLESKSSTIACWNLNAPPRAPPLRLLSVKGLVCTFCTSNHKSPLVIAGLSGGVLALWDLKEEPGWHQEHPARSPTFIEDKSHHSPITSLFPLEDTVNSNTFQCVSIEERSKLIIWTVLEDTFGVDEFLGLAHWGSIRLVPSTVLDLSDAVRFMDVCCDKSGKRLFVAGDDGQIHHFYRRDGRRPSPQTFKLEVEELSIACSNVVCSEELLFGGYMDGHIRVYNMATERPILVYSASQLTGNHHPLLEMRLSPQGLFLLDTESSLHAWSISRDDSICSISSVHLPQPAVSIDVNTRHDKDGDQSLMALGYVNGAVDIYTLRNEFSLNQTTSSSFKLCN